MTKGSPTVGSSVVWGEFRNQLALQSGFHENSPPLLSSVSHQNASNARENWGLVAIRHTYLEQLSGPQFKHFFPKKPRRLEAFEWNSKVGRAGAN